MHTNIAPYFFLFFPFQNQKKKLPSYTLFILLTKKKCGGKQEQLSSLVSVYNHILLFQPVNPVNLSTCIKVNTSSAKDKITHN